MRLRPAAFWSIMHGCLALLATPLLFMVAGLLLGGPSSAAGQTCGPNCTGCIPINVAPGDGSTPVSAHASVCAVNVTPPGGGEGCFIVDWSGYTYCMMAYIDADFEFYAYDGDYFRSPDAAGVHCVYDPEPAYCSGSVTISLYAKEGAVDGHVTVVPDGSLAGHAVWLQAPDAFLQTTTDTSGYFTFRESGANDWGVPVGSGEIIASGAVGDVPRPVEFG